MPQVINDRLLRIDLATGISETLPLAHADVATYLLGSGLGLGPGQVVGVLGREGGSARVRVGGDLSGLVRADALLPVAEGR